MLRKENQRMSVNANVVATAIETCKVKSAAASFESLLGLVSIWSWYRKHRTWSVSSSVHEIFSKRSLWKSFYFKKHYSVYIKTYISENMLFLTGQLIFCDYLFNFVVNNSPRSWMLYADTVCYKQVIIWKKHFLKLVWNHIFRWQSINQLRIGTLTIQYWLSCQ